MKRFFLISFLLTITAYYACAQTIITPQSPVNPPNMNNEVNPNMNSTDPSIYPASPNIIPDPNISPADPMRQNPNYPLGSTGSTGNSGTPGNTGSPGVTGVTGPTGRISYRNK